MATHPHSLLNLEPLAKAVDALRDAVAQPETPDTRGEAVRRFDHGFEVAWMTLRRFMAAESAVRALSVKELFRQAGKQGIVADVGAWFAYLKCRDSTSGRSSERRAEEAYRLAAVFLADAQAVLDELRRRTGGDGPAD